jgi:glyoxylase-like metal-dependent hydrolase (beta-lactamase superfamily II)
MRASGIPQSVPETTPSVRSFETRGGAQIYQIPLEEFPGFWGYAYLALVDGAELGPLRVLIDTGSGFGSSNEQLERGLRAISELASRPVGLESLSHILITHGHIDHFGGLSYLRPRTRARVGVHELDLRVLTNYEERLAVVVPHLREYFTEAGVSDQTSAGLIEMYTFGKRLYFSTRVDFTYEAIGMQLGPFEMMHVPGHCAGHVVIRLHDVLFTGDHILDRTSPHQSPESLTLSTGLDHYLQSLKKVRSWAESARIGLGGHKEPILDLPARLDAIEQIHAERLAAVVKLLQQPHTISEVSQSLFGEVHGYNVLLALEEAGAHVEYLYQRGLLGIANLDELEGAQAPVPIRYYALSETPTGFRPRTD